MTDFDALIDNVVESAKECENEHEHRGFYTESIKKNHDAARSALREAIAEVEDENGKLRKNLSDLCPIADMSVIESLQAEKHALMGELDEYKSRVAALEAELAEADDCAERLARPKLGMLGTYHCRFCDGWGYDFEGEENVDHADDCPVTLNRARLSKRGQG